MGKTEGVFFMCRPALAALAGQSLPELSSLLDVATVTIGKGRHTKDLDEVKKDISCICRCMIFIYIYNYINCFSLRCVDDVAR